MLLWLNYVSGCTYPVQAVAEFTYKAWLSETDRWDRTGFPHVELWPWPAEGFRCVHLFDFSFGGSGSWPWAQCSAVVLDVWTLHISQESCNCSSTRQAPDADFLGSVPFCRPGRVVPMPWDCSVQARQERVALPGQPEPNPNCIVAYFFQPVPFSIELWTLGWSYKGT